ncbi:DUF7127 family protein [Halobacterium salinarum]|uniref:Hsp20/alpha crystallin family protein n=4 Tax=Halobacterium salinarum TaxID=2242 RepID=Q9HPU0_HALSA|nr:hypothetical protein [Halobacterium salinarum]AAG19777.1 hypothetical protein VNG_1473H [Halobacterium salinarum NRC-1]MBB6088780.1 HSP20 family molecular chaperone IbpA [Halobacterium salinarum]MDL0118579.1 hypothetical protein [Halobacterium salinarum]MDL0125442.1 hypothetical protein [Halobacterium salinarum]MDL0128142.1 hypothetical protein [Halobacterium salinarum]
MTSKTHLTESDPLVRRYDYGDAVIVAADLGVDDDRVAVDVVQDTAIVTRDDSPTDQYELPVPDGDSTRAFINNGVVTVEVSR